MTTRRPPHTHDQAWWRFVDQDPRAPATGVFQATRTEQLNRLYLPLVNEAGGLSWTSPRLQGGPAASHHEYLAPPLTAEDLPHALAHRDLWIVEPGRTPFSVAGLSPEGLTAHVTTSSAAPSLEAGPGWVSLTTTDARKHFRVRATLWCPADVDAPLECFWVEVRNVSRRPLVFDPYAALPVFARSADNVRDHRHVTALLHRVTILPHGVTVCPTMSFDERGHRMNATRYAVLAFGPGGSRPSGVWGVEEQFLGAGGNFAAPAAVWNREAAPMNARAELAGREAIGGFRFPRRTLAPGQRATYLLLSGITRDPDDVTRWVRWGQHSTNWTRSLTRTKTFWQQQLHRVAFFTADRALDHWLTWVTFQPMLRRLYGNSYLPQFDYGRGGRGWRDLWQDCLALLLSDPSSVRPMLLHNVGGIRIDGSNATIIGNDGGFIADRNNIPRTWMDHGAWPLYTTWLYLHQTGDVDVLLRQQAYFRDPQLFRCRRRDPHWDASYGFQLRTRRGRIYRGSIFEHLLVQNLTAFFNVGGHNVCRLEGADWNDGLDMAGRRGESAAFSAFYAWNLARLAALAELLISRGHRRIDLAAELRLLLDRVPGQTRVNYRSAAAKRARLERYLTTVAKDLSGRVMRVRLIDLVQDLRAKHDDLANRIRTQEWIASTKGAFFNGYYDDQGKRVEGPHPSGLRMTLTGQVFPVMSGIASDEQVDDVVRAVNRWLRDPQRGGIRLNTDFGGVQPALGRAFSFAYGEKENGAVFSHMAVMYAYALYVRRRPEDGRKVWRTLYTMATDQPIAKIFPGLPEYFNAEGRGLYCYLTGSASWLIALLLTHAYGIRGELGDLVIDPQLTREDFGTRRDVSLSVSFADRPLMIRIVNRHRVNAGRYLVTDVRRGTTSLPCVQRPGGGVRIARRVIAQLSPRTPTRLDVILGRRG